MFAKNVQPAGKAYRVESELYLSSWSQKFLGGAGDAYIATY